MNPLISIIIPTYNRPELTIKAIQSILNQEYQNFEILIIDDCSDTNYYLELPKIDSRIRIFHTTQNSGPAIARNIGLENTQGKYIGFLDSDDEYLSNHLQTGINFLENNPEYDGVYFNCTSIKYNKKGRIYGFPWEQINKINPLRVQAMIFRKNNIRFDKDNKFMEDYRFWKKFAQDNLKIKYEPIVTCIYRKDFSSRDKLTNEELIAN